MKAKVYLMMDMNLPDAFADGDSQKDIRNMISIIAKKIDETRVFEVTHVMDNLIDIPEDWDYENQCMIKWKQFIMCLINWALDNSENVNALPPTYQDFLPLIEEFLDEKMKEIISHHHPIPESQDVIDSCSINRTEVGESLKTAREKADITKSVLAVRTGLTESMIECYESGDEFMDPYVVPCISNELGISVRYLLFGDKTPKYAPVFFDYPMDFPRLMQGPQHKVLKFIDSIHRFHSDGARLLGETGPIETLDGINNIAVTDNVASFSVLRRCGNTWNWMNESQNLGEGEVIMALNQYLKSPRMKAIATPEIIPYIS